MQGYKRLLTYQLARIIFDLGWDIALWLYPLLEDHRQRDQMKQAARSLKQNIVEGSEERSLSSKLKLQDVARASLGELLEDAEDFLRLNDLPRWSKDDPKLKILRHKLENYPSGPSCSSGSPSSSRFSKEKVLAALEERSTRKTRGTREEQETVVNYLIDLLLRCGYLLDKQINALEEKHRTEGGYNERLYQKRKQYRGY